MLSRLQIADAPHAAGFDYIFFLSALSPGVRESEASFKR